MELNEYKGKIMCSCTGDREREVALKTCPHLFCKKCIDDTTINRNRKCPLCRTRFTKTDVHEIKWN
jgi:E3 ubiquitin-protein ligase BRE1